MNDANKVLSFVLGLVVVVVFIAIVTGKLNVGKGVKTLTKGNVTVSPTVTPTAKVTIIYPTVAAVNPKGVTVVQYNQKGSTPQIAGQSVTRIPSTGAETMVIPAAFSMLAAGTFLKKLGKKRS